MNRSRVFVVFGLLGFGVAPVAADGATAGPSAEGLSLEGFGAKTPACLEWSDGCAVCARDDRQASHCSTPGIACQPGPIACRAESSK